MRPATHPRTTPVGPPVLMRRARRLGAGLVAGAVLAGGLAACTTGSGGGGSTTPPPAPTGTATTSAAPTPTGSAPVPPTNTGGPASSAPATGAATSTPAGSNAPSSAAAKQVDLVVTYSGWDAGPKQAEVDAFAPGVLAADATCTLVMTANGVTRTATRKAQLGPSSTQCGALTIPGSRLAAGAWQAVVRFSSATAVGESHPVTITVG